MPKPRTWVYVIAGLGVAGVLAVVLLVGAGAWFFAQHVQVSEAPEASAEKTFGDIRRRFEGQAPLIDPRAELAAAAPLGRQLAVKTPSCACPSRSGC